MHMQAKARCALLDQMGMSAGVEVHELNLKTTRRRRTRLDLLSISDEDVLTFSVCLAPLLTQIKSVVRVDLYPEFIHL